MKRLLHFALLVLILLPLFVTSSLETSLADGQSGCYGGADGGRGDYWLRCDQQSHGHGGGGPLGGGGSNYYVFLWLPACPNALPGTPGADQVDCTAAHNCDNPKLLSLRLYSRLYNGHHEPLSGWRYMRSECRSRKSIGPGDPRHTLRWSDVRSAILRMGVPRSEVAGPRFTLVNLPTTFFTRADHIDRTLRILGFVVDVEITPATYLWHWGDGQTTTTHTPGRPYPAHDVMHTYREATAPDASLPLRVDVAYQARFRVDGGAWITVNDQLVIGGITRYLPVKQASAVLVPPQ